MTEAEFETVYGETLISIEDAIEDSGIDLDYETVNDILTLTCKNESVIIITRQSASKQLWLAARSGGFHFDYDEEAHAWMCTTQQKSLFEMLTDICLEQGGVRLAL